MTVNPDLSTYLLSLPAPAIKIWLKILSAPKKKCGEFAVLFNDHITENDISTAKFNRLFKPKQAHKIGLLQITDITNTSVTFKLFKKTQIPIKLQTTKRTKKISKKNNDHELQLTPTEILPVIVQPTEITINRYGPATDDKPVVTSELLPHNYQVSHPLLRALIFDYCEFYKSIQANRALLAGQYLEKPLNPRITHLDRKGLIDLAMHFKQIGSKSENGIRLAFQTIYACWHQMPNNYQDYYAPMQMLRNINGIVLQMQKIRSNIKNTQNQTKKDANTTEKLNNAEQRDYSHLVRPK